MTNSKNILFISGSPRNGNTNFVLSKIYDALATERKEMVFLKDEELEFCKGCLACHHEPRCIIKDNMTELLSKMQSADIFILGSPNYFDNVSGLMKNFIDRCHPLYKKELVRGKKLILIMTGGGDIKGTEKYLELAFFGFVKYLKLKLIGSYSFQALNLQDLGNRNTTKDIAKIVQKIKSI